MNFTLDVAGAPFARFRTTPNAALDPLAEARWQPAEVTHDVDDGSPA